jgi:hypothetical protein
MSEEQSESTSTAAFIERMKARAAAYDLFCKEFQPRYKSELFVTFVPNDQGTTDQIALYSQVNKPEILEIDLDREKPVNFGKTTFAVHFQRWAAPVPQQEIPQRTDDEIWFDFDDGNSPVESATKPIGNTQEKITEDLKKKFSDLGFPNIPIEKYALRLVKESREIDKESARLKADAIAPLYRNLEVKRLLTDPNSHEVSYYEIAKQRQYVYDQLTELLRESGMDPSQVTEYLMHGLFDSDKIAGIPIFEDEHGDHYVVVDYSFSGYDEQHPVGSDFSGKYEARPGYQVDQILSTAEEHGYTTYFYNKYVSGGTHQQWNWHGIKIEGFDKNNLESNTQKVLDVLKAVGVDPQEAANPNEDDIQDRFIRNV